MKKFGIGIIVAASAALGMFLSVSAAPKEAKSTKVDPFQGTFKGMVHGDKDTSAPLTLVLDQTGSQVKGNVFLGQGLYVDGGMCGAGYIPNSSQSAAGKTSAKDPRHLSAQSNFNVSGVNVKLYLDGDISAGGDEIEAQAKIDLPWFCGRDPVISGTLLKAA